MGKKCYWMHTLYIPSIWYLHLFWSLCRSCNLLHNLKFVYGPNPVYLLFIFVLFSFQYQIQHHKLKKRKWCAWDSNPGLQDGWQRLKHGAMAATPSTHSITAFTDYLSFFLLFSLSVYLSLSLYHTLWSWSFTQFGLSPTHFGKH